MVNKSIENAPQIHSLEKTSNQKKVKVKSINSGCSAKTRLSHLGIVPGIEIIIISAAPFHGPLQVKFRDTQLCIGRGIAEKIIVDEICNDSEGVE